MDNTQRSILSLIPAKPLTFLDIVASFPAYLLILLWENLLEDQEKRDRKTQKECDAEKVWIENKRQELLQVEKEIEVILNQSVVQFAIASEQASQRRTPTNLEERLPSCLLKMYRIT